MNIKGLDYNTDRSHLLMSEYGREIQKMVEHALTIADRKERQICAETIVATMMRMIPQEGSADDRKQKLWHHLAIMSDFKLDIDYPVDITSAQHINEPPQPLKYSDQTARVRHYGAMLCSIFEKLKTMPEGEERNQLVELTANQMKRCLAQWGHGSCDDEKVADDLARFTDGVIQLDLSSFTFAKVDSNQRPQQDKKKKKK